MRKDGDQVIGGSAATQNRQIQQPLKSVSGIGREANLCGTFLGS